MTQENKLNVTLEHAPNILITAKSGDIKEVKENNKTTKKIRIIILILNIFGTLSVLSQCICSILRSISNIQFNKIEFMDIQVLIISFLVGIAEMFVLLVLVLQGKLRAIIMNWFTFTKSMHSYFVVQIMFSFIQGPQSLFPSKILGGQPNQFYNIYNTLISCFLIIGWIFNTVSYVIFLIALIFKKKQEKKSGQQNPSPLY